MARKWHLFFRRLQSLLSGGAESGERGDLFVPEREDIGFASAPPATEVRANYKSPLKWTDKFFSPLQWTFLVSLGIHPQVVPKRSLSRTGVALASHSERLHQRQSLLGKRSLAFCCSILMLLFCVTIQPALFIGARVNAASSALVAADNLDEPLAQSQQLYRAGDYPAAIKLLEKSIEIYRSRGDNLKQAIGLSNLALAHQELGQWDAANRSIAASLNLLQNLTTPAKAAILAQTLDIQGQLQLAQGQTEAALGTWEQTEKLSARMGDDAGVVRARIDRAQALRVLGFYRRSQTLLEELQTTLATKPDTAIKIVALRSLGTALAQSGDLDKATIVLDRALKLARILKLDREIGATQLVLGNVSQTKKHRSQAIAYYIQAAKSPTKLISIQAQLNLLSLQIGYRQTDTANRLIIPIQQQLSTLPSNRIKLTAQINFAESLSRLNQPETAAKVLADVIQQAQKLTDRRTQSLALGSLGELYKQQRQWQDAEDATSRALTIVANANADDLAYRWYAQLGYILAQQGKDKPAIESYTMAIDTLKSLRKDLVNINRDVQFTFKESVEPTYRELVSLLLKPENQQANGQNLERSRNLIEALQVAELDNFFREACLNNENVIIDNGKINTLVFVIDGAFRNIPMSILYDGKQYLIEKNYAIATNLGLRLQSPKPISRSPLHILAAGLAKPSPQFASSFSELPEVPAQLKAIRDTGIDLTELKDRNFTIQAFGKEVKNTPYNVIHMATHGQFSSNIEQTFLLANDDKLNILEFNRLLRDRAQIQKTPIELLVMSACETAVGDNRATLGLAGVAVKAGAQSTLASLWKVKDSSTAVLMGEFYRELKTGKVSKAEALRLAQLKLMKEYSNFSAPLYWAPFILVGNWL
ncbi:CHAT domain-containing protein [Chamaesiphon sp. VAR_48_metabat_403]|uniref:CHAT domain-containing protein n=1 Tax=Chamaesiphon sp. VAR_48_metabat_403 TaxID=2964700 RepID=UPI00286E72AA|nr:CHAT domain-containing protein [Chamaesiphon sp. VAR_48_metabat_403]